MSVNAQLERTPEAQRARLTARDFWLLAESGAFEDYAKVELIEGEIWVVNAVHSWHARTQGLFIAELTFALRQLASPLIVYGAGSVEVSDDSVPEPDLSVGEDTDEKRMPLAATRIAVEISDSSAARDLGVKARLYGAAGIPEYWVVDREQGCVVQLWSPSPAGYTERRNIPFGDPVEALTIPGLRIDTAAVRP